MLTSVRSRYRDELKAALEEKGRLHAEAARLEETKSLVADRDGQIEILQSQVKVLEREKAEAVKDARSRGPKG